MVKECLDKLVLLSQYTSNDEEVFLKQLLVRMLSDLRGRPMSAEEREGLESRYPSNETIEDLVKRYKEQSNPPFSTGFVMM